YATRRVAGGETAAVGVGQEQHHFSRQERGQALDRVERLVGEAQARLAFDGPVEADGGRRPGRGVVERCERVRGVRQSARVRAARRGRGDDAGEQRACGRAHGDDFGQGTLILDE